MRLNIFKHEGYKIWVRNIMKIDRNDKVRNKANIFYFYIVYLMISIQGV